MIQPFHFALRGILAIILLQSLNLSVKAQQVSLVSSGEYPTEAAFQSLQGTYPNFGGYVTFTSSPLVLNFVVDGQYYNVATFPTGQFLNCCSDFIYFTNLQYYVAVNIETGEYSFSQGPLCSSLTENPSAVISGNSNGCSEQVLYCSTIPLTDGWEYQWLRNGVPISGETNSNYNATPSSTEGTMYSCVLTCPGTNSNVLASEFEVPACYSDTSSSINYLLVQNVTTTGNIPGQSIQVQFDLNWGNTWKDDVNWDAVWVFMKYKDAQGLWKHAKISPTGYDHGQGTPNLIEPTADQMGAFVRLALEGQGNFNSEGMQLRWNYGADGLSSVSGLEVRVFAMEMVYHPEGGFSVRRDNPNDDYYSGFVTSTSTYLYDLKAPGDKVVVVNNHLSPKVSMEGDTLRIKGDAGMDYNADGVVDNTNYPTGYYPFYLFKYELSEQQYADFLNCLTPVQRGTLGVAGSTITEMDGDYYAANPNRVCTGANPDRLLAYADWSGLRPMSYLELQKAFNGPKNPDAQYWFGNIDPPAWDGYNCDYMMAGGDYGSGFYGAKSLWFFAYEPFMLTISNTFSRYVHGNGTLSSTGLSNTDSWLNDELHWGQYYNGWCDYDIIPDKYGFRLTRSAE